MNTPRISDGVLLYCHKDRNIVGSTKRLLAATSASRAVSWDGDFEAGDDWFEQISLLIDNSTRVLLFWCVHAATSSNVRREIDYCLSIGKPIVPVLFDHTPLPADLAHLHALDLRQAIRHK